MPLVLENQEYLQVFWNDEHLNDFLSNASEPKESIALISKRCVKFESLFIGYGKTKGSKE